jgi:hypothetical protein
MKEIFLGSKGLEVTGYDVYGSVLPGLPYEGMCEVWSSPALVDLDGDGTMECLIGEGIGNKGNYCARILALNHDGTFVTPANNPLLPSGAPGWPRDLPEMVRSSPAVGDLDRDGTPEVLIAIEYGIDTLNTRGQIFAFRYDGSPYLEASPVFAETECGMWATPCLADLDDDGMLEVIACDKGCAGGDKGGNLYIWNHDGEPYIPGSGGVVDSTGVEIWSSPAVGDIDGDGFLEIVAVNMWGRILAWNHDGTPVSGSSPVITIVGPGTWSSPALADLDGDGTLEIAVGFGFNKGKFALVRWDGSPYNTDAVMLEWEYSLGYASPAIADIDGDGELEIMTCSEDGHVMALETDGSFAPGYPIKLDGLAYSSPLIDDIDRDGDIELILPAYDSRLYVWDTGTPYSDDMAPWPMFHHDMWRTGFADFAASPDTTPPALSVALFQNTVLGRVVDVFVMAGTPIQGMPEIQVVSDGQSLTLDVTPVPNSSRVYRGHHQTGISAPETVYVSATDHYGNAGTETRVITYSRSVGDMVVVTSADGVFEASATPGDGTVLAVLPVDTEYLSGRPSGGVEMEPAAYNLCVIQGRDAPLSVSVRVGTDGSMSLQKFEGGWVTVDSQVRDGDRIIAGDIGPGIYAIGNGHDGLVQEFHLSPATPNPFGSHCKFRLIASRSREARVCVYDVRGRLVDRIFEGLVEGTAEVFWDGRDSSGRSVASGIYFVRAQSGTGVATRKVILVR